MISQAETLEDLKRKINVSESLCSIVKTMKLFSLVNINHYERAVEALSDYCLTVDMGLDALLRLGAINQSPQRRKSNGIVVVVIFGSDQGLCGKLNKQIVEEACEKIGGVDKIKEKVRFVTVGHKVKDHLEDQNYKSDCLLKVPASVNGINKEACELLEVLDGWRTRETVESMYLIYQRHLSKTSYTPHIHQFLPINLKDITRQKAEWKWHSLPWQRETHEQLKSCLIRQYIFVSLYRAYAESLASENAARLDAMQNAEKNITEHLDELNAAFSQKRQGVITEELLDVVAGYETMRRSSIIKKGEDNA